MNNLQRKGDWYKRVTGGGLDHNTSVSMWVLPHGCICKLHRAAGMPILENGAYSTANSILGDMLTAAGIDGTVIIASTEVIPQNTSRWLTWWLSTQPTLDDPLFRTITVTTLGQTPKAPLPFQVNVIEPMTVKVPDVRNTVRAQSRNPAVSLFLLEENDVTYRLEPERRVDAKVIDCTEYGYVLKTANGHVFLASMVSRRVQGQLEHHKLSSKDLIGATVKVEYTMFTDGNRLCNYKSPIVFRCVALDDLSAAVIPSYHGPYLFKSSESEKNAILTATRCSRARIYSQDGVIVGRDEDSNLDLFTFRRGADRGMYAAVFENGDGLEAWRFESSFATDVLDPDAFIRCVELNLFSVSGYSIKRLGLRYVDQTQTPIQ